MKPKVRFTEPNYDSPMMGQKLFTEGSHQESNPPAASLPTPLSILRSTRGASASKLPPPGSFSLQTDYKASEVLHPHLGLNIVKKGHFEYRSKEQDNSALSTSRLKNSRSTMNLSSSPSGLLRKEGEKAGLRPATTTQGAFLNVYLNPASPGEWQLKGVTARAQKELKKKTGAVSNAKQATPQSGAPKPTLSNMLRNAIDVSNLTTLKSAGQRLSATLNYLHEGTEKEAKSNQKDRSLLHRDRSRAGLAADNERAKDAYKGHVVRQLQGRSQSRGVSREVTIGGLSKPPAPEPIKPQVLVLPSPPKPVNMKQQQTRCFNLMNSRNPRHASYFSSVGLV